MSAKYPSLRVEGGFFAAELLDSIADGGAPGQAPRDFGLADKARLLDQISSLWSDARGFWTGFNRKAEALGEGDAGTTFTRNQWVGPLFGLLGYDLAYQDKGVEVEGLNYAISHRADRKDHAPPVHVVGVGQSLDRRAESGRPRLAPHSLLQEYLNRTEQTWGVVTNGYTARVLRDSQLLRRQAYLEFDLKAMFAGERFADFAVFYRMLHRSRLPHGDADPKSCLLEQWYQRTIEQGGRVREKLREGVETAMAMLANGMLRHPANLALRHDVESGNVTAKTLYGELLRLIYRLLFLMVTEERNLLTGNPTYREHYSISRLRSLCERRVGSNNHTDLWTGLVSTFRLFHSEELGHVLEVPPLNGDLFELNRTATLNSAVITNREFLEFLWCLSTYREQPNSPPRHINYGALDVEELGSVYESLLDLQPVFGTENGVSKFQLIAGTDRKTTGSYYTPPELVDELVKSALVPVMEERLKAATTPAEKEQQLLSMTVCDPACGSGHFLLAAARRLGRELAIVRSGEDEPSPAQYRAAVRDTIANCIYGVDKNTLAVELCKVALWLESHAEGKPLSFLDHRILCGDSLVGALDLSILGCGIPDEAYKPVTGDDKEVAKDAKRHNTLARERLARERSFVFTAATDISALAEAKRYLAAIPDDSPALIRRKRALLDQFRGERAYEKDKLAADLWTYAFFALLKEANVQDGIPTAESVQAALEGGQPHFNLVAMVGVEADRLSFFHWPLEFPEVFQNGGFDVLLCNPPWERIKLQQQEYFASRDLEISRAPNSEAREQLVLELQTRNPKLWAEFAFSAHDADATSKYLRCSGQYPQSGQGDVNTYSAFSERLERLIRRGGRVGAVIPTGIATDDSNKDFFNFLVQNELIRSLFDFENREGLFPAVDSRQRFSLITMGQATGRADTEPVFGFFLTATDQLADQQRIYPLLSGDFALLNPNTRTCPTFRTRSLLKKPVFGGPPPSL